MQGTAKYRRLADVAKEVYNDKGCCGVIAVAIYCDVSYGKAHAALARAGRKNRCGTHYSHMTAAIKERTGEELAPTMTAKYKKDTFTVNKAPEKRYP